MVLWTPGALGFSAPFIDLIGEAAINTSTPMTLADIGSLSRSPGRQFLIISSAAFRVVAAQMRVAYTGPELDRSGFIGLARVKGSALNQGTSVTTDQVAPLVGHYNRTPSGSMSINWHPSEADGIYQDLAGVTPATVKDSQSALLCVWENLPPTLGVRFSLEVVYEWIPQVSSGLP